MCCILGFKIYMRNSCVAFYIKKKQCRILKCPHFTPRILILASLFIFVFDFFSSMFLIEQMI